MSICKANPCCQNYRNCVVPLPQHKSGLDHLNARMEDRLKEIEKAGVITEEDSNRFNKLHWCPEWDLMLVHENSPEYRSCQCFTESFDV